MTEKGLVMSGIRSMGVEVKIDLSLLKARCWRGVQFHGLPFRVRRLRGATTSEKPGMNF